MQHAQCGTGLLADPGFRHQASPSLSPKVSVSGHVYDIATGRITTAVDARYARV